MAGDGFQKADPSDPSGVRTVRELFGPRAHSEPGTWSAGGWRSLRFGMAPGDVVDALKGSTAGYLGYKPGPGWVDFYYTTNEQFFGEGVGFVLAFFDGSLRKIEILPSADPAKRLTSWEKAAREGLRLKYGAETLRQADGATIWFSVNEGRTSIVLADGLISYVDKAFFGAQADKKARAMQAEADKL